jgi:ABC-type polysaccharide transport system permease subunit
MQKQPQMLRKIKKSFWLYVIFTLPFVYYVVFHYAPLYGIVLAFKDFNIMKGIMGGQNIVGSRLRWIGIWI